MACQHVHCAFSNADIRYQWRYDGFTKLLRIHGMKKKIILITTSYPRAVDGSEAAGAFVRDFAQALAAKAQLTVLAPGTGQEPLTQDALTVVRYLVPDKPLSLLKPWNPLHWLPILRTLVSGKQALYEHLGSHPDTDHILALWVLPSGAWAKQANAVFNIPYSTWALGSDIWTLGKIPVISSMLRRVLNHSRHNFADGLQLCDDVERLSGKACSFLPSTREFSTGSDTGAHPTGGLKLAFLGRWHPNKGADMLITALSLLDEEDWQHIDEVRIFGGGPLQDRITRGVRTLREAGRPVSLGGYLDRDGAQALFSWCDYVLIPSRIESIPVVFSDAMKAGRPIITTPVGDLGRLVNKYHCGLVTNDASAEEFARVLRLARNTPLANYKPGVEEAARDFSLPVIVDTFLAAID